MRAEDIIKILPQIEEIEKVDFSQFTPPYPRMIAAFVKSGRRGLHEFQRFVEENGLGKEVVKSFLIALFQYLLIRYRRFGEYSVVRPLIKIFVLLRDWLNKNNLEKDWEKLLSSFVGYLLMVAPAIVENEDCRSADFYLTIINDLAQEASIRFDSDYYDEILKRTREILTLLKGNCKTHEGYH